MYEILFEINFWYLHLCIKTFVKELYLIFLFKQSDKFRVIYVNKIKFLCIKRYIILVIKNGGPPNIHRIHI